MSDQIPRSWEQVKTPTLPPDNPKSITSPESTIVKKLCFFQFSGSQIVLSELKTDTIARDIHMLQTI